MTHAERYAALSLVATLGVFAFLVMRFTEDWTVVDQPAGRMLGAYVAAVALSIVAESVIAALLAADRRGRVQTDERDLAVRAKADQAGWIFAAVAVNLLIGHLLLVDAWGLTPSVDLTSTTAIVFALLAAIYGATAVQRLTTLALYRLQA